MITITPKYFAEEIIVPLRGHDVSKIVVSPETYVEITKTCKNIFDVDVSFPYVKKTFIGTIYGTEVHIRSDLGAHIEVHYLNKKSSKTKVSVVCRRTGTVSSGICSNNNCVIEHIHRS